MNKENLNSKGKSSHGSALKHINGAASVSRGTEITMSMSTKK
ncbi:hypothetical protein MtrunA17_Chr8g0340791 [Medicago truncatula]|uniref:Uncharacterized protein n=1 Tax=Medicago truncatula TaxID=3880 RepID=A0A396GC69_MEDTR|nr:hypothetical protein MtrunA17_Chr8g0340791 [Medicago truncatula]